MNRGIFSAAGVSAVFLSGSALAGNPVYHCDAGTVVQDARVIVYPTDDVSMFSDPNNQTCTFTLNGATEDGPSQSIDQTARKEIISRLERGDISFLINRLTAAWPSGGASDAQVAIEKTLSAATAELTQCFRSLAEFGTTEQPPPLYTDSGFQYYLSVTKDGFSAQCRVMPSGTFNSHSADVPVLLLRSESSRGTHSLFIPQGAIR